MAKQTTQNKDLGALWLHKAKSGTTYLQGKVDGKQVTAFYVTKKSNPKEPDLRIYAHGTDGALEKNEMLSLWCKVSKNNTKYLTGNYNGKWIVAFTNDKVKVGDKLPRITIQYQAQTQPQPKEEAKSLQPQLDIQLDDPSVPF